MIVRKSEVLVQVRDHQVAAPRKRWESTKRRYREEGYWGSLLHIIVTLLYHACVRWTVIWWNHKITWISCIVAAGNYDFAIQALLEEGLRRFYLHFVHTTVAKIAAETIFSALLFAHRVFELYNLRHAVSIRSGHDAVLTFDILRCIAILQQDLQHEMRWFDYVACFIFC